MLDPTGRPWLAPAGITTKPSLSSPPIHSPPNANESAIDRARYGFGVFLYKAVTGVWPFEPTGDQAQLRERQRTPIPVRQVAPDLPEDLQRLLDTRVHPNAPERARAATPPPIAPPTLPLSVRPPRPRTPAESRARPAPTARRDTHLGAFAIVLDQRTATAAARRRLAALLDRPAHAFVLPAGAPADILVEPALTMEQAQERLHALAPAGAPLRILSTDAPATAHQLRIGGVLGALLLLPTALLMGSFIAAVGAVVSAAAALAGQRRIRTVAAQRDLLKRTGQYTERGPQPAAALSDGAQRLGLARRAQATRKAILLANLPDPVRVDLLAAVDELEAGPGTDAGALCSALDEIRDTASSWEREPASAETALNKARKAVAAAKNARL
ncbi:MAG TPA: hypothetical protein DFR83_04925 [Deltaproteobacteria bacterium]|nr:hypothetical protein [Deltaproteobacteria bacterium]